MVTTIPGNDQSGSYQGTTFSRATSVLPPNGFSRCGQGLKPGLEAAVSARLKPCPDTKHSVQLATRLDTQSPFLRLFRTLASRSMRLLNLRNTARVAAMGLFVLAVASFAAEKQRIQVNDYIIHVVVSPQTHQLKAQARVKFTALEDINIATFELHNALRPTRVIDTNGQSLSVERVSQDSTVRISLPNGLTKGSSDTLIFEYEGALQSADDSPVPGIEAGLRRRSDHLSALCRTLVPDGGLRYGPIYRDYQRQRSRGLHRDRQRQAERRAGSGS